MGAKRNFDYRCSKCGLEQPRHELVAKQISYKDVGKGGRMVRSRTVAWLGKLCGCLYDDPPWSQDAYMASPGMSDADGYVGEKVKD